MPTMPYDLLHGWSSLLWRSASTARILMEEARAELPLDGFTAHLRPDHPDTAASRPVVESLTSSEYPNSG